MRVSEIDGDSQKSTACEVNVAFYVCCVTGLKLLTVSCSCRRKSKPKRSAQLERKVSWGCVLL